MKSVPPHAPFAKVGPVSSKAVTWTTGFWADRFATCAKSTVPAMGAQMHDAQRPRFVGNFEIAAGLTQGSHRGPKWDDGDFYKWLEAAAAVLERGHDPKLDAQLDEAIKLIASAQRADGYIHTDVQIKHAAGDATVKEFGNPLDFEMYNMGHLMSAACVHHRATGKTSLLDVAIKSSRFLDKWFASPTPEVARHGICPSHLVGLTDLYRTTGDRRHVELAARLLDMRNLVTTGDDDNQDRVPFREHKEAHGHAVRATYLYAGMADVFQETGDETLLPPMLSVWDDLVSRKLYITGAAARSTTAPHPTESKTRRSSRESTKPSVDHSSCPTGPLTMRRVPRSATCCGPGGCSRSPAKPALRISSSTRC